MSNFRPLLDVEFRHDYSLSGRIAGLRVVPLPSTRRTLGNLELIFRQSQTGILILLDESRQVALASAIADGDDVELQFAVTVEPDFGVYTEGCSGADSAFYFTNTVERALTDGAIPLHDGDVAATVDRLPASDDRIKDLFRGASAARPDIVICLRIGADEHANSGSIEARTYRVSFAGRLTRWKYFLLGTAKSTAYEVVGPNEKMRFSLAGEERLADETTAITFLSDLAIPLRERYSTAPLLRIGEPPDQQVLIKHLPVAGTDCIACASLGKDAVLVSEMYVNY